MCKTKAANREHLGQRLRHVDAQLAGKSYLTGETFTAADAYLWTIFGWAKFAHLGLAPFANIEKFISTVAARPAVIKSLQTEGLARGIENHN